MLRWCLQMGIQDQYPVDIFQWCKFSHSPTLLLSLHNLVHSAITSICADAQCTKSKIEKYLACHSVCQRRQWRHDKGNVQLVTVWEREGKEGRYLPSSDSAVGLTVYHTWLKICQIVCFGLFLLH